MKITHAPSQVVLPTLAQQKINADLKPVTRKKPTSPLSAHMGAGGHEDDGSITNLRLKPRLNKIMQPAIVATNTIQPPTKQQSLSAQSLQPVSDG